MEPMIYQTIIERFAHIDELDIAEKQLLNKAKEALENAYAPYSQFYVGAALLLETGEIITGNNQENVAYPSGICAERTAIFYASSQNPNMKILKIAIAAKSPIQMVSTPVYPCGSCRQALVEYENKAKSPITVIMMGEAGEVHRCASIETLLPSFFQADFLKKD